MAAESYKNNSKVKTGQEFKFKILVCNIRSIFNKTENFEIDLVETNPDIVCMSETWLNDSKRLSFKINIYHTVAGFHRKTKVLAVEYLFYQKMTLK